MTKDQRRGGRIKMSDAERDAFLTDERTCRVASITADGSPHVTPLWFVWDGEALWLNSIVRSQRWTDLQRDPRVAIVVDAGIEYHELRGVEIRGVVESVGETPRPADPASDPRLEAAEARFGEKYMGGTMVNDGKHGWLRVTPEKIVSWDFRKM
ncbi:MAG: pyridoxamine 5-phosphate oxidase-related FMN-binding [Aeromicrobium sp.]|nr:pyridoxamine 5-phosphate oxidase-related FMN-binding [Aeromicrobium sp.]